MKKAIIPVFLLLINLNGWATGRFSIFINGVKSGQIKVERKISGNVIETKTTENTKLQRGSSIIETKSITIEKETKSGIPVYYKYKSLSKNTTLIPEIEIKFSQNKATILALGTKKEIPIDNKKVKLSYGEKLLFSELIQKNKKQALYRKFEPAVFGFDTIKVTYLGKTDKGYEFTLKSQTLGTVSERVTDKNGNILIEKLEISGITVKVISEKLKQPKSRGNLAEVFTPSLIPVTYFFPKGYTVQSVVYRLKSEKDYDFTILKDNCQQIKLIDNNQALLTVSKQKLSLPVKIDKDKNYLVSSKIINLSNDKLGQIAENIKKKSKNNFALIANTVNFVYNYVKLKNFDNLMADSDTVLKTKSGDCTEHSFLATAIFRKLGIPARTVVGLVMGDNAFGYHMWVEIKVNGKWFGVDPTFNQLSIDPTHIKIDEFPVDTANLSEIYKLILPLINSLTIDVEKVEFTNGKTINKPGLFFKNLFNMKQWGFDNKIRLFYLKKASRLTKEKVYFFESLYPAKFESVAKNVKPSFALKTHIEDLKQVKTAFYLGKNRGAFCLSHNGVYFIYHIRFLNTLSEKELKEKLYQKAIEVIDKCRKEF